MTPSMVQAMAERVRKEDPRLASDLDDVADALDRLYRVRDAAASYVANFGGDTYSDRARRASLRAALESNSESKGGGSGA